MAEYLDTITYPLDNTGYSADEAETYFAMRKSGVMSGNGTTCFQVVPGTNPMTVVVKSGLAWVKNGNYTGKSVCSKTDGVINLTANNTSHIVAICIVYDAGQNKTRIMPVSSANMNMPSLNATNCTYLVLAKVTLNADMTGTSTITDAMIEDMRESEYCGLMADPITSIDTSVLNTQAKTLINDLEEKLRIANAAASGATQNLLTATDVTNISVPASGWTGSAAPYSQTVAIEGLVATDMPIIDIDLSSTSSMSADDVANKIDAYGLIGRAVSSAGYMTLYSYTEKPVVDFTIKVRLIK